MSSSPTMSATTAKWDELSLQTRPDSAQLDRFKTQLDLVSIALESLGKVDAEAMIQSAKDLNLTSKIADRIDLWRQQSATTPLQSSDQRLNITTAKSLVLIVSHLAHQQQDTIRQIVAGWEKNSIQDGSHHREPLLADYIDDFIKIYRERIDDATPIADEMLDRVALKLLLELLFYSSDRGHQYLWNALLERSLA
jgi:hypothetical protein